MFPKFIFSPFLLSKTSFPVTTTPEIRHIFVIRAHKAPVGKVLHSFRLMLKELFFSV